MFVLVEHGDFMPFQGELIGTGQTGRATADDRHFFTGWFCTVVICKVITYRIFAKKMFYRIDPYVVFQRIAIATGFARCGANPAHY